MAKAAFNKKKALFTSKLDLNLRKKLVKCYIWSMALYDAETWTLRVADQKYLDNMYINVHITLLQKKLLSKARTSGDWETKSNLLCGMRFLG
jgi:hypothetical protein